MEADESLGHHGPKARDGVVVVEHARKAPRAKAPPRLRSPASVLRAGAAVFEERDKVYGRGWPRVGLTLQGLFPEGVMLKTPKDHERFSQLVMMAVKLTRYAHNFHRGGHSDSLHDLAVYAAILETIDQELRDEHPSPKP